MTEQQSEYGSGTDPDPADQKTNSLIVASAFRRYHKDILRDIRTLLERHELASQHFDIGSYQDKQNKSRPLYILDKIGFESLVMGFTGDYSVEWRVEYILSGRDFTPYTDKERSMTEKE